MQSPLIFKLKICKATDKKRAESTFLVNSAQHKTKIGAKMMWRKFALPRKGTQLPPSFPPI
ncbi:hypothetical protein HMP0015_0511 [Acinetobacter haemolyticus ATCC 19194]|uniref:Uncharacterized protein n=1 Tax=Acinetobacter haemolyticus ATCC 19194 TaxID=707232 RepID=D4XLB9_ACIHA|nr:hypothetical protein AHTJS_16160 [Acinetobacter haemolyticus]ATZ68547.1 hypothetical protein BSR56_15135 [Acinetobacter haemolyticus]EEH69435.1 hypothetical protein HMPREF0023_1044 [Acinetobacter sp. ATCC 27244]EFF83984.1 hypothetical protein HMP0015_0511 [Acinetobacter haemolyticus ATCC 19194]